MLWTENIFLHMLHINITNNNQTIKTIHSIIPSSICNPSEYTYVRLCNQGNIKTIIWYIMNIILKVNFEIWKTIMCSKFVKPHSSNTQVNVETILYINQHRITSIPVVTYHFMVWMMYKLILLIQKLTKWW